MSEEEEAACSSNASGGNEEIDDNAVTNGVSSSWLLARVMTSCIGDTIEIRLSWYISEDVTSEDWIGLFFPGEFF